MKAKSNFSKLNDEELIVRFVAGEDKCFTELYNRHRTKLLTTILLVVKEKELAEDLLQEGWMKIVKVLKAKEYKEDGKFLPFANRIMRNLSIDYWRKHSTKNYTSRFSEMLNPENLFSVKTNAETEWMSAETCSEVSLAIDELPKLQKEVIYLRHFEEMSFKEIAEKTEVPINTALGRMRYAINNLKKRLS